MQRREFLKQSMTAAVALGVVNVECSASSQAMANGSDIANIELDDITSVDDPRLRELVESLQAEGYAVYFEPEDVAHLKPGDVLTYDFETAMQRDDDCDDSGDDGGECILVNAEGRPWRDYDASSPAHVVKRIYSVDHRYKEFFWCPTVAVMLQPGEVPARAGLEPGVKELRIFNPRHLKHV